jgi:catechol 2,3-dioxygenase-like lactoylglutathione lyase family enzyme
VEEKMSFVSSIIVVEDVVRSRELYERILNQEVIADFGIYNVSFEGGFAMYNKSFFQELVGGLKIVDKSNNFVLYFEVDNLPELEKEIIRNGFEFIHQIREQPWQQRTFRFYDYDNHILEVAEKMDEVSYRLFKEEKTIEEISKLTGIPVEEVLQHINKYD